MGFWDSLFGRRNFAAPPQGVANEELLRELLGEIALDREDIHICGEIIFLLNSLEVEVHDDYMVVQPAEAGKFRAVFHDVINLVGRLDKHARENVLLARHLEHSLSALRRARSPNPNFAVLSTEDRRILDFAKSDLEPKINQLLRDSKQLLQNSGSFVVRGKVRGEPHIASRPLAVAGLRIFRRVREEMAGIVQNLNKLYLMHREEQRLAAQAQPQRRAA